MSSPALEPKTSGGDGVLSSSQSSSDTPKSLGGSQDSPFTTPRQTPLRNKALENLAKGQGQGGLSPVLKIPATPIMQRLGYGTGVGVFLLERSPRASGEICSPWAIKKTVKVEEESDLFAARIQYEAEILKQLCHPNIIGYRAFGKPSPDGAFLAMERAGKSLSDLIEDRVEEILLIEDCDGIAPFPATKMAKVALDMAKALTYLHDDVKMIHGDLKSANVLVFGDFETIKLCDFGVARKLNNDGVIEGAYVGTEIWNPMEVVRIKRGTDNCQTPITYKADMYPFGLTLHEMMTLKPPHLSSAEESYLDTFEESTNSKNGTDVSTGDVSVEESFDEGRYEDALSRYVGTRPLLPDIEFDSSYNTVLGVFYCCTDEDPAKRPNAKDIVIALEADAEQLKQ